MTDKSLLHQNSCVAGPDGCDPTSGELVCCAVCDEPCCDYHGSYPSDEAYIEGDWRCPECVGVPA